MKYYNRVVPKKRVQRAVRYRTMKYPEMVRYYTEKFDPTKESIYHFVTRKKPHHVEFLKKRGWGKAEIDAAWAEIIRSLSRKKWRHYHTVVPEQHRVRHGVRGLLL